MKKPTKFYFYKGKRYLFVSTFGENSEIYKRDNERILVDKGKVILRWES